MARSVFETPLGKVVAVADEEGLCSLDFDENASASDEENVHLTQLQRELSEYFAGKRKTFDVCLNPKGTPF